MTPEAIHLVSMIGLLALADSDLAEFMRVTDLSRHQLNLNIKNSFIELKSKNTDLDGIKEVQSKLDELENIRKESVDKADENLSMRNFSDSCARRAMALALSNSKKGL